MLPKVKLYFKYNLDDDDKVLIEIKATTQGGFVVYEEKIPQSELETVLGNYVQGSVEKSLVKLRKEVDDIQSTIDSLSLSLLGH